MPGVEYTQKSHAVRAILFVAFGGCLCIVALLVQLFFDDPESVLRPVMMVINHPPAITADLYDDAFPDGASERFGLFLVLWVLYWLGIGLTVSLIALKLVEKLASGK